MPCRQFGVHCCCGAVGSIFGLGSGDVLHLPCLSHYTTLAITKHKSWMFGRIGNHVDRAICCFGKLIMVEVYMEN